MGGRSVAVAFATEMDLDYSRPFNTALFHFGGTVGDIYIADRDITIGGNAHTACVEQWGEWQSAVAVRDGSFPVRSLSLAINNFPLFGSPLKRFTDLWLGLAVEAVEVSVYQNFKQVGTGTILQELLGDFVMRPGSENEERAYTPYVCSLDLAGISEKYIDAKKQLSWIISQADFPLADPDDVGKRANLIVGYPKTMRCHWIKAGLQFPLQEDMSVVSGYVAIPQDAFDLITAPITIQIGDEQITAASKTTDPTPRLTALTRQVGGSPLQKHNKDDTIVQVLTEYTALANGRKAKSISNVKVWRHGIGYPLTGWTTELANTALKPGETIAIIKIPTPPVIKELPVVELTDSQAIQDTTVINDGITIDRTGALTDTISVIDNIGVVKVGAVTENIGISQANTESKWDQQGSNQQVSFPAMNNLSSFGGSQSVGIGLPAQEKTKSSGSFVFTFSFKALSYPSEWAGINIKLGSLVLFSGGVKVATDPVVLVTNNYNLTLQRVNESSTTRNVSEAAIEITSLTVKYAISTAAIKTGTVQDGASPAKTGSAAKGGGVSENIVPIRSGAVTQSGAVSLTGATTLSSTTTAEVVLGEYITCDIEGEPDDGAGLYTGTPNALIEKPADVVHYLLRACVGVPVSRLDTASMVTARNDSPASYKFAANLAERESAKDALLGLGMQGRLQIDCPVDKFRARFKKSVYPAAAKTLTEENILSSDSGETTLKIQRSAYKDLINLIVLYFDRDWTVVKDLNAFSKVYSKKDTASIADYGERRDDLRFLYDYIAADNEAMAQDIGDFRLDELKKIRRIIHGDYDLGQFDLLEGDIVALSFKSAIFDPVAFFGPGTPTIKFGPGQYKFSSGKVTEYFDGLNGENKFLVEEVRHIGGYDTQMALVLREVT